MKVIGQGNTADVYEWGDGKALKLFKEGFPVNAVEREYRNASLVEKLGIPCPKTYGIVHKDTRSGILYDRLEGKSMLQMNMEGADLSWIIQRMADLHKEILSHSTDEGISYQTFLKECLGTIDSEEKELLIQQIEQLPDGNCLCHGDFHPGNLWVNKDGTVEVIDFMNICHGPAEYDIARTYYLVSQGKIPESIPDKAVIQQAQKLMAKEYLIQMDVSLEAIEPYLSVIKVCRRFELG